MSRRDIKNNNIDGEYLLGRNLIREAIKVGRKIYKIYIENGIKEGITFDEKGRPYSSKDPRIHDIITSVRKNGISLEFIPKDRIQSIERQIGVKSEGVVALAQKREALTTKDVLALCKKKNKEPFIVVINNILYEENLGAVLRTLSAGGVDALIIPKRDKRDLTANVARISMGGSEYVQFVKDNLFESLDAIHREGIKIVGVELSGSSYYFDEDLTGPIAIVLGGEDAGISEPLLKRCDSVVRIPMIGQIQSLNVSVSTAIIIYEKVRQECQN